MQLRLIFEAQVVLAELEASRSGHRHTFNLHHSAQRSCTTNTASGTLMLSLVLLLKLTQAMQIGRKDYELRLRIRV
jgi:hypothetical protein